MPSALSSQLGKCLGTQSFHLGTCTSFLHLHSNHHTIWESHYLCPSVTAIVTVVVFNDFCGIVAVATALNLVAGSCCNVAYT